MSEVLSGAQILCRLLEEQGVDLLFGYPGGAIMPFYHALPERPGLRHILVRHEQAAAHAADGYARASGRPGVCVATSGPGATNLVTGIATAQMDSSPLVAITGQVPRAMIGRDAFQETDVVGITLPITKHSVVVEDVTELAAKVREAFTIATEGRPGPVLIDIPKDVQNQKLEWGAGSAPRRLGASTARPSGGDDDDLDTALGIAVRMLAGARRPLLMVGHGVILSRAYDEVRALAEKTGIPVITTLLGISAFPESHPLHLGMPGMHGEVHVNRAIQHADVILAIGLRFDDRVTGNTAGFAPQAQIIHLDLDRTEIGKNIPVALALVGDARALTARLTERLRPRDCDAWRAEITAMARERAEAYRGDMAPDAILAGIREVSGPGTTVVSDVGQHQMLEAQYYPHKRPLTMISSGGLGTMGFGLPAAIGAKFGNPDEEVWAIVGDGGFQMTMPELATAVQEGIHVTIAIINNGFLGMVRQWQELFHDKNYSETPMFSPDFVKIAEAYGIPAMRITHRSQVEEAVAFSRSYKDSRLPVLLEFVVEKEEMVYPMVPAGANLHDMVRRPKVSEG